MIYDKYQPLTSAASKPDFGASLVKKMVLEKQILVGSSSVISKHFID